jgi:hypothetical protein
MDPFENQLILIALHVVQENNGVSGMMVLVK